MCCDISYLNDKWYIFLEVFAAILRFIQKRLTVMNWMPCAALPGTKDAMPLIIHCFGEVKSNLKKLFWRGNPGDSQV